MVLIFFLYDNNIDPVVGSVYTTNMKQQNAY